MAASSSKKYGPMKKKPGQKGYKVEKTMREFGTGQLHSGSKKGPKVKNRKQAIAIGLSEARKAGEPVGKKKAVKDGNRKKRRIGSA